MTAMDVDTPQGMKTTLTSTGRTLLTPLPTVRFLPELSVSSSAQQSRPLWDQPIAKPTALSLIVLLQLALITIRSFT